jgi:hypothetical protein
MPYDEELAQRIRETLAIRSDVQERKMFGGLAFMLSGTMACGVVGDRPASERGVPVTPAGSSRARSSEPSEPTLPHSPTWMARPAGLTALGPPRTIAQ